LNKAKLAPLVAIVGGGSLLGREVRDVLSAGGLAVRTKLIGTDESEARTLTAEGGEPVVMTALDEENLAGARVVFLAGSAASSSKAFQVLSRRGPGPAVVDLTHALEDHAKARLRAPVVEPSDYEVAADAVHVIAHPASIVLAFFYTRLRQKHPFRRSIAHVFEPASERGQPGLDELRDQTVSLLAFKRLPKAVFDEQVSFNLLARYGSEAPEALEKFQLRIERDLASLLASYGERYSATPRERGRLVRSAQVPSLRLIQAPVFHGHSFSVWVEFEESPIVDALEQALACPEIDVRDANVEAPTNVGIAGQSGIAVGAITVDSNDPRAAWFWVVADNFRIVAENAVAVARALIGENGRAG
jgi:aspartate-semialdehyde dehydrogenase